MTLKPPPLPGSPDWPSAPYTEEPLEPMSPAWARRSPWAWAALNGGMAGAFLAGLFRFPYGWAVKESLIVGGLVGIASAAQSRWFATRSPWQPGRGKIPFFNIRKQPRWFGPGFLLLISLSFGGSGIAMGVIEARIFETLWGITVIVGGVSLARFQWKYLTRLKAQRRSSH